MTRPEHAASFARTSANKASWTLARTCLTFVAAYVVWQPSVAYALAALFHDPAPFASVAQLPAFLLAVGGVGFVAGVLWWMGARLPRGQRRWLLRSTSRMLALTTMLTSSRFVETPVVRWLSVVAGTAILMGVLFHWTERWEDQQTPASSAP